MDLIRNKIHPTHVINGYKIAMKHAVKYIEEKLSISTESMGEQGLINIAKTSMSSKLIGGEDEFFSKLAVSAISSIKTLSGKYSIKNINIIKAHGLSFLESAHFNGFVLWMSRVS